MLCSKSKTFRLVMIAVFSAVLAACSQISIPLPGGVPLTLQTFAVALCGCLLGFPYAILSVVVWLLLGAIGAPVFASFRGSLSVLLGPTGGFLFGFLPMSTLCSLSFKKHTMPLQLLCGLLGLLCCHALGSLQYALLAQLPFGSAAMLVSVPYLIKDILSVIGAYYLALLLKKRISFFS